MPWGEPQRGTMFSPEIILQTLFSEGLIHHDSEICFATSGIEIIVMRRKKEFMVGVSYKNKPQSWVIME